MTTDEVSLKMYYSIKEKMNQWTSTIFLLSKYIKQLNKNHEIFGEK